MLAPETIMHAMNDWFAARPDLIGCGFYGLYAPDGYAGDDPSRLRPYLLDRAGRRWLVDGSGDVA